MRGWTIRDALDLYNVQAWGADYLTINDKGHVEVRPRGSGGPGIDLLDLVQDLQHRGLRVPMLIRFSDILASRVKGLCSAFANAIGEYGYEGRFRGVYPIKVNQQRHVVEEIVEFGAAFKIGLEAGSKPELLIALAHPRRPRRPDHLQRLQGPRTTSRPRCWRRSSAATPIIVVDRFREVETDHQGLARARHPPAHRRARQARPAKGAGKWAESTGDRSKFGLTAVEIVRRGRAPARAPTCSTASSCCTSTSAARSPRSAPIKDALREATRIFVEPARARRAARASSTSAAASASTTTARRPTSTRR